MVQSYRTVLAAELKKAEEAFEAAKGETMKELEKMASSGIMDNSVIDRITAASDRVTEIRHKIRKYGYVQGQAV